MKTPTQRERESETSFLFGFETHQSGLVEDKKKKKKKTKESGPYLRFMISPFPPKEKKIGKFFGGVQTSELRESEEIILRERNPQMQSPPEKKIGKFFWGVKPRELRGKNYFGNEPPNCNPPPHPQK